MEQELIESMTTLELIALQHGLREFEEDKEHLDQVLKELDKRWKERGVKGNGMQKGTRQSTQV